MGTRQLGSGEVEIQDTLFTNAAEIAFNINVEGDQIVHIGDSPMRRGMKDQAQK